MSRTRELSHKLLQCREHPGDVLAVGHWPIERLLERMLEAVVGVELKGCAAADPQKDGTVAAVTYSQLRVVAVAEEAPLVANHDLKGERDSFLGSQAFPQAESDEMAHELPAIPQHRVGRSAMALLELSQLLPGRRAGPYQNAGGHVARHEVVHHGHPVACRDQDQVPCYLGSGCLDVLIIKRLSTGYDDNGLSKLRPNQNMTISHACPHMIHPGTILLARIYTSRPLKSVVPQSSLLSPVCDAVLLRTVAICTTVNIIGKPKGHGSSIQILLGTVS